MFLARRCTLHASLGIGTVLGLGEKLLQRQGVHMPQVAKKCGPPCCYATIFIKRRTADTYVVRSGASWRNVALWTTMTLNSKQWKNSFVGID